MAGYQIDLRKGYRLNEAEPGATTAQPASLLAVRLREVLGDAGIEGFPWRMFPRTVATVLNEQVSVNLAAQLLGHTDPKVTIEPCVPRDEQVNPPTAELLDGVFGSERIGSPFRTPVESWQPSAVELLLESGAASVGLT